MIILNIMRYVKHNIVQEVSIGPDADQLLFTTVS